MQKRLCFSAQPNSFGNYVVGIEQLLLLLVGELFIDNLKLISQLHDLEVIESPIFVPRILKIYLGYQND